MHWHCHSFYCFCWICLLLDCFCFWQMMEEIFLCFSGAISALPAMVQILADFASADGCHLNSLFFMFILWFGFLLCLLCFLKLIYCLYFYNSIKALQFTPRLKGVLSRVLPVLGNVRDVHRPIFANGMFNDHFPHCWICAIWYWCDYISGKPEHESWF